jgi:hypothetical protein
MAESAFTGFENWQNFDLSVPVESPQGLGDFEAMACGNYLNLDS